MYFVSETDGERYSVQMLYMVLVFAQLAIASLFQRQEQVEYMKYLLSSLQADR